jgi:hypothetical protein
MTGTPREDRCTFLIMSRSVLLSVRNVSDTVLEGEKKHTFPFHLFTPLLSSTPPHPTPPENRAVYEILCKNIVEPLRQQVTIWRMHFECWMH